MNYNSISIPTTNISAWELVRSIADDIHRSLKKSDNVYLQNVPVHITLW